MKVPTVCCLALSAVAAVRDAQNPLGEVISLLDNLAAKITKEGETEAAAYVEFVEWCDDASKNKGFEIKTGEATKAKLQATIGKTAGDAEAATAKIEELASSIAGDESDLKSATTIRQKEVADFTASEAELVESIDTIGRAVTIIEREMQKNPAAFAQVDASSFNSVIQSLSAVVDAASFTIADKQRLSSLVQAREDADDDDLGAPAAAMYKSHSTGILDVLEDLKEKAEEQLAGLRKAETNAQHNYNMLKQSLEDQMGADTKDMEEQKAAKASSHEAKATAEGDLAETVKMLEDGKVALQTVTGDCMTTAADHEATVTGRKEELTVIAQAKQLLAESTSGAVAQSYSLLQVDGTIATGTRLHTKSDLAKAEVVTLVRRLAKEHHSAALAQLASRIAAVERFGAAAGEDPFSKVKGLISDMIAKLMSQASSEATEKAYCDEQMSKTEEKKGELEYDVSKLTSKIDKAVAASAGLKEDVTRLQSELSALVKSQAEMDKIRRESHAAYAQAKVDLETGLRGVRKALGLLRDYYGNGEAAMLQNGADVSVMMQQPDAPEHHEKASGAGSSIIGILEVVESDFAKNLATEEAEEADAQSEYEKTTQENEVTKTMKEQDVKYSTQEFKGLDKSVAEFSSDRETMNTELSAVLEYYSKIKDRCIAKPETYGERQRRREAEISGLKDALSILEDETALTQRGQRGFRGHFLGMRS